MSVQRKIYDKEEKQESIPKLPFILVRGDGVIGEADSLRGLISFIIPEYLDSEDNLDDWNLRVKYARRQAMFALERDQEVIVYDKQKGIINNNYAAASDDEDYEILQNIDNKKIYVDNEKDFIRSLVSIGVIKVLEREDISFFSEDKNVECDRCAHHQEDLCNVYNSGIIKECESGINIIKEITGANYKPIAYI